MRKSQDQYITADGQIVTLALDAPKPPGLILWNGYDYENQYWVHNGKRDTRTIEELKTAIANQK